MANPKQRHRVVGSVEAPGTIVMVPVEVLGTSDGLTNVSIDVSTAAQPVAKFAADTYWMPRIRDEQHLVFAQSRLDGKGFRAVVDIRLPSAVLSGVAGVFKEFPLLVAPDAQTEITEEPPEAVSLYANAVRASHGTHGNCLDFFIVSPFSFATGNTFPKEVPVEPVVRVMMPGGVLVGVISFLREAAAP